MDTDTAYDCELIGEIDGNALLNTAGGSIANLTTTGNLYLTQGLGSGETSLTGVTADTLYIWGGGPNSVSVTRGQLSTVVLGGTTNPHLKLSADTKLECIEIKNTSSVTHGGAAVRYDAASGTISFGGTIEKVELHATGRATVTAGGITYDVIPPEGTVVKFVLESGSVVKEMILHGPVNLSGTGKISALTVNASGSVIETGVNVTLYDIIVKKDVTVTVFGKLYTGTGGPLATKGTGGGSSGGGSSGGETTPTEFSVGDTYEDGWPNRHRYIAGDANNTLAAARISFTPDLEPNTIVGEVRLSGFPDGTYIYRRPGRQ